MICQNSGRILLCLLIVVTLSCLATGQCLWNDNDNPGEEKDKLCQARPYKVICSKTVTYELTTCRKHVDVGDYQRDKYVYEYNIVITIENPNEDPLFKNLTHYTDLTLVDGYLVTVPQDVFKMTRLTSLRISGNKLRIINFKDFLPILNLKYLDLANNTIIVLADAKEQEQIGVSAVIDINLSFNSIETVPNYFLYGYRELEHLNISHNMISSIGGDAFSGLVQLKTLDLCNNRLTNVENLFAQLPKLVDIDYKQAGSLQKLSKLVLDDNFIVNVNFTAFFETGIPTLSIGGNKIPCYILARFKYSKYSKKFNRTVTAKKWNFVDSNSVNGISCEDVQNDVNDLISFELNNSHANALITLLIRQIENYGKTSTQIVEIVDSKENTIDTTTKYWEE